MSLSLNSLLRIRILSFVTTLCFLRFNASAADYYFCDCQSGASVGCVSGADVNDGLSPATAKQTFNTARQIFNSSSSFHKGDSINFCQGGSFLITNGTWLNLNCKAENDCVVKDYIPSFGSNLPKPFLYRQTDGYGFNLSNGGNPSVDGGVSFRNLNMQCQGCTGESSWGFFAYNEVDNLVIENVTLDGWAIGVHLAGAGVAPAGYNGNRKNDNVKILNSLFKNSYRQGVLGGANDLVIDNNKFLKNGGPSLLDHNIYLSSGDAIVVKNNELYQSALDAGGNCIGVSLVVHGHVSNMLIESNYIHEDIGKAGNGCWGIAVDTGYATSEEFRNIVIRGNRVENVGNVGIGLNACQDCVIENNIVIHEQSFAQYSIAVPNRSRTTSGDNADLPMERITVRNNSILAKNSANGGAGVTLGGEGSGHILVSNAIHYTGTGIFNCISAGLPVGNYSGINNNVCAFPNANSASHWELGSGTNPDPLTAWSKVSGFDKESKLVIPGFLNINTAPYDLRAISNQANLINRGHPTLSSLKDFLSNLRDQSPDAGAYDSLSAEVLAPGSPSDLKIKN